MDANTVQPMPAAELRRRMRAANSAPTMAALEQYARQRAAMLAAGERADSWTRALVARARHAELTDPEPA